MCIRLCVILWTALRSVQSAVNLRDAELHISQRLLVAEQLTPRRIYRHNGLSTALLSATDIRNTASTVTTLPVKESA
jgi:hypothetical protein